MQFFNILEHCRPVYNVRNKMKSLPFSLSVRTLSPSQHHLLPLLTDRLLTRLPGACRALKENAAAEHARLRTASHRWSLPVPFGKHRGVYVVMV
jgi:hypothetical protein